MTFRVFVVAGCAALLAASSANAAVTVIGSGLARACYQAAEFGTSPREGVETCTLALNESSLTLTDKAATYINRGLLEARAENNDTALNDYNTGLRMDPTLGEGYVDRGAVELVMHDLDRASTDINQGIALHANKLEIAYYDRAILDEAQGNIRAAYEDYKMAVQLAPDFTLASQQLVRFKVVRKESTGT